MIIADGRVKPNQAKNEPKVPFFKYPIHMPTWLDDGPGKKFEKDTISMKVFSSNHFFFITKFSLKYAMWAIGPPNDVRPNKRN